MVVAAKTRAHGISLGNGSKFKYTRYYVFVYIIKHDSYSSTYEPTSTLQYYENGTTRINISFRPSGMK